MAGDVFLLGSTSWRIRRVEKSTVRVKTPRARRQPSRSGSAKRQPHRRALGRSVHAAQRARCQARARRCRSSTRLARGGVRHRCRRRDEIARYLDAVRGALGLLPTRADLVIERFFDETGGMQLVCIRRTVAASTRARLLLRKRFCTALIRAASRSERRRDRALARPQHSFPLDDMRGFLRPGGVREALVHA